MGIHIMILIMAMGVCMIITEVIIRATMEEVIMVGTTVVIMVVFMVDLVCTVHSDITAGGIIITAMEIKVQYMEDMKDPVPCHPDGIALLVE